MNVFDQLFGLQHNHHAGGPCHCQHCLGNVMQQQNVHEFYTGLGLYAGLDKAVKRDEFKRHWPS